MNTEPMLEGRVQTADDRENPLLRAGNTNCGGCGMSIGLNFLSHAMGTRPVRMVIPACCAIVTAGPFPTGSYGAPVVASTFASAAAVATGLAHVADLEGRGTRVICWAGDGGTYDIGLATLSAAAERDEDILYICYDNEIYGNTGGQRSGATPAGATTTTTPVGKDVPKKNILAILAVHDIPYAASVSLAHPEDAHRKMQRALDVRGFRFLHILAPCPTGWKSEPSQGIELVRLAVRSGLFPVVEIDHGTLTVDVESERCDAALERYFELQGRFRNSPVPIADVRAWIDRQWARLPGLCRTNGSGSGDPAEPIRV